MADVLNYCEFFANLVLHSFLNTKYNSRCTITLPQFGEEVLPLLLSPHVSQAPAHVIP